MIWRRLLRSVLSAKMMRRLQGFFSALREEKERVFITQVQRPTFAAAVGTRSDSFPSDADTAIVIQGPLALENHFTLNSVLLYRQHYPESEIIVSTWRGQSSEELGSIERAGASVVLSDLPAYSGISNTNYQIVSTRAGIEAACDSGKGYVLKTRTDQRFYAPSSLEFLLNLLQMFPVKGRWKQKRRIAGISLNTFKYRLYGMSDMFLFGGAEDLLEYWQCPLDKRRLEDLPKAEGIYRHSFLRVCEVYFCTEYLARLGRELGWTLADSYAAFGDHFIVVNAADLDLIWPKYSRSEVRWPSYQRMEHQQMDFREWLNLYCQPARRTPDLDFLQAG